MNQVDYRNDPSCSAAPRGAEGCDGYDTPVPAPGSPVSPQPDRQIQVYDLPGQLAGYDRLALNPDGALIPGYSPDLERQLQWERQGGDGSPA